MAHFSLFMYCARGGLPEQGSHGLLLRNQLNLVNDGHATSGRFGLQGQGNWTTLADAQIDRGKVSQADHYSFGIGYRLFMPQPTRMRPLEQPPGPVAFRGRSAGLAADARAGGNPLRGAGDRGVRCRAVGDRSDPWEISHFCLGTVGLSGSSSA